MDGTIIADAVSGTASDEGKTPMERRFGERELVSPIIATTIVLAAVYTPIGLQGGLTGPVPGGSFPPWPAR